MKAYLIDVKNRKHGVVETDGELESLRKLCNCDLIDITYRCIGGKQYLIVCDDEGALKSDPIVSARDLWMHPMLVGNLLVFSAQNDDDGNMHGLDEKDVETIKKRVRHYFVLESGEATPYIKCTS